MTIQEILQLIVKNPFFILSIILAIIAFTLFENRQKLLQLCIDRWEIDEKNLIELIKNHNCVTTMSNWKDYELPNLGNEIFLNQHFDELEMKKRLWHIKTISHNNTKSYISHIKVYTTELITAYTLKDKKTIDKMMEEESWKRMFREAYFDFYKNSIEDGCVEAILDIFCKFQAANDQTFMTKLNIIINRNDLKDLEKANLILDIIDTMAQITKNNIRAIANLNGEVSKHLVNFTLHEQHRHFSDD